MLKIDKAWDPLIMPNRGGPSLVGWPVNLFNRCSQRLALVVLLNHIIFEINATWSEPRGRPLLGSTKAEGATFRLVALRLGRGGGVVELLPILLGEKTNLATTLRAVGGVDTHQICDVLVTLGAIFVVVVKIDGLQGASVVGMSGMGASPRASAKLTEPEWVVLTPALPSPSQRRCPKI